MSADMAEEQDTKDCLKLAMLGHGLGRNQGLKKQHLSSTICRHEIRKNGIDHAPLSSAIQDYIKTHQLYTVPAIPDQAQVIPRIEKEIRRAHGQRYPQDELEAVTCLNTEGKGGISGELVFEVTRSQQPPYFIKAFVSSDHATRFQQERRGMEQMSRLAKQSQTFEVPNILYTVETEFFHLMAMEQAQGVELAKSISQEELATACARACLVGKALKELHSLQTAPITSNVCHSAFEQMRPLGHHPWEALYNAAASNPGHYVYQRGDASAYNLFACLETQKVCFIDLFKTPLYLGPNGEPRGLAAREWAQVVEGFEWLSSKEGVPESRIQPLQEAFLQGYGETQSTMTDEMRDFFTAYWQLRR